MEGLFTGENAFIKGRFSMEISFTEVKFSIEITFIKEMFNMDGNLLLLDLFDIVDHVILGQGGMILGQR